MSGSIRIQCEKALKENPAPKPKVQKGKTLPSLFPEDRMALRAATTYWEKRMWPWA